MRKTCHEHHTPSCRTDCGGRIDPISGCCRNLARAHRQRRRSKRTWRHARCIRALVGTGTFHGTRAGRNRRQSRRCGQQYRLPIGGASQARWLYPADWRAAVGNRAIYLQDAELRPAARLAADTSHRAHPEPGRRQCKERRSQCEGACRFIKAQSGQIQLRLARRGNQRPPRHRIIQRHDRHRYPRCALQIECAIDQRGTRQRSAGRV